MTSSASLCEGETKVCVMEPRAKKRRDGERYVQRSASSFCMTEITEARDCERGRLKATGSAHVARPISKARRAKATMQPRAAFFGVS